MNKLANIDRGLLRCFLALVGERSVSRAAVRIGISQPAMSSSLARLRELLGDPVLLRANGAMTPTPRALEMADQVADILERIDALLAGAPAFDPATSTAAFVLTAPGYVENTLIPEVLKRLRSAAPRVSIEVRSVNPEKIHEWLETGEVDIRIGWARDPQSSLRSTTLIRDRFVCLVGAEHPWIRGRITLDDFVRAPHVRTRASLQSDFWRWADEAIVQNHPRPRLSCVVQDYMATPRIVAESDLIATIPERLARRFAEQYPLQILAPPFELPTIVISGYWHERTHSASAHKWFRGILAETAAQL